MDRNFIDRISRLASHVADEYGFEFVDVGISGSGRRTLLRIVIDREGGITLNDCSLFSRRFESLLDVEDPFAGHYTLEVSSPGLDRPLSTVADFKKNIGKLVRIITKDKIDNQGFFVGRLTDISNNSIGISVDRKGHRTEEVSIPFDNISRANLEIEIGRSGEGKRPSAA